MSLRGSGISLLQAGALLIPGGAYRSGQRLSIPSNGGLAGNIAIAANTMYAWPIPLAVGASISGVSLQVGTAVAGVSGKLGLARSGSDGRPGALIAEAPSAVDMNSTAGTELVASFSAAQFAPAGIVWGLCVFNGLAQPITLSGFGQGSGLVTYYMGATTINTYTAQAAVPARLSRAHTYADAFPATLTGWSQVTGNPSSPVMAAVVA